MPTAHQLQKYLASALPFIMTWSYARTEGRLSEEELLELYRYATLGKIAAGFFHELSNPLTAVSLNLETMRRRTSRPVLMQTIKQTERMERFLLSARAQMQGDEEKTIFSVNHEIEESFVLLAGKAKSKQVKLQLITDEPIQLFGNSVRFCHIITNLVSNAIDAYGSTTSTPNRQVEVSLLQAKSKLEITVKDYGEGIKLNQMPLIFKPFYTTKGPHNGLGVGLSLTKESIERDFKGTITVVSRPKVGTSFKIVMPNPLPEAGESGNSVTNQ